MLTVDCKNMMLQDTLEVHWYLLVLYIIRNPFVCFAGGLANVLSVFHTSFPALSYPVATAHAGSQNVTLILT